MRTANILICTAASLAVSGCGFISHALDYSPTTALKALNIVAELDANQNMGTEVDLVFVFDKNALTVLPTTSPDWFANRDALQAGLASGIAVLGVQVVPGSTVTNQPLPGGYDKAVYVYSYASYVSAGGQAAANITAYKCALITLRSTQISYTSCLS
jgi:hypothetical protein